MSGRMPQPIVNTVFFSVIKSSFDFHKLYPDHGGHVVCASPFLGGLLEQLSDNHKPKYFNSVSTADSWAHDLRGVVT